MKEAGMHQPKQQTCLVAHCTARDSRSALFTPRFRATGSIAWIGKCDGALRVDLQHPEHLFTAFLIATGRADLEWEVPEPFDGEVGRQFLLFPPDPAPHAHRGQVHRIPHLKAYSIHLGHLK